MSLKEVTSLLPTSAKDENGRWTWETKVALVQRLLIHGNTRKACEELSIPIDTFNEWRKAEWFTELIQEIKLQQKLELNNRLGTVVEKALTILEDRMENGDYVLNNKTGEIVRKEIPAKEAAKIANEILQRKIQIEKMNTEEQVQHDTVQDTLKTLAKEFAKFNNKISKQNAETIEYVEVVNAEQQKMA